jgi:hypothetical protein
MRLKSLLYSIKTTLKGILNMYPVSVSDDPEKINLSASYAAKILYLATHTQYGKRGLDITEVMCWTCEKPLANGMRLVHAPEGDNIRLIVEPISLVDDEENGMELEDQGGDESGDDEPGDDEEMREDLPIGELLLVCTDCAAGLEKSLKEKSVMIDPSSSNPLSEEQRFQTKHFILPNKKKKAEQKNAEDMEIEDSDKLYASDECFIYVKKMAWVVTEEEADPEAEESEEEAKPQQIKTESLVTHIFVEANPDLPEPLFNMAKNTIALFQLNSRHYKIDDKNNIHTLQYQIGETPYDDLRLIGRMQAYQQAKKAFKQLKMMQARYVDIDYMDALVEQHQILLELSGYFSTWRMVFNDGNDPGSFTRLSKGPILPIKPIKSIKKQVSDICPSDSDSIQDVVSQGLNECDPEVLPELVEEGTRGTERALKRKRDDLNDPREKGKNQRIKTEGPDFDELVQKLVVICVSRGQSREKAKAEMTKFLTALYSNTVFTVVETDSKPEKV